MAPLWSPDPLSGVVVWGSAGVLAWTIIAAFVGSLLGILREVEHPRLRRPPQVTLQRPRRPPLATALVSPEWQPAR